MLMVVYNICPACGTKTKVCSRCEVPYIGESVIENSFSKNPSRADGYDNLCKTCREAVRPEGQSMHKLTESVKNANVGATRESAIRLGDIPNKAKRRRAAKQVHKARADQAKAEALRKKAT